MKTFFLTLVAIIVAVLLVAAVMPKDFKIERTIVINKPQSEVFDYLKMVKNQNDWSPWIKKDPNIIQNYTGEDGTVGSVGSWSGNKEVGSGEQEIVSITPERRIDFVLRFSRPMKTTNKSYFITEAISNNQTKVTWGMVGRTDFPFNIICYFMQGKVKGEFATGLSNLKQVLESK